MTTTREESESTYEDENRGYRNDSVYREKRGKKTIERKEER